MCWKQIYSNMVCVWCFPAGHQGQCDLNERAEHTTNIVTQFANCNKGKDKEEKNGEQCHTIPSASHVGEPGWPKLAFSAII